MEIANTPWRIFISVSRKSSSYDTAWDLTNDIINTTLDALQENNLISSVHRPEPHLLAKQRMSRIEIVFDIYNDKYNCNTAHLPGHNDLPVIAVYFNRSENKTIIKADKDVANAVNRQIRELHDNNGFESKPPFEVDYSGGNVPTYLNPRTQITA